MPAVTPDSTNSVVILRVRGVDDAGATLIDVVKKYASSLREVDSKLMIVTGNRNMIRQLRVTGTTDIIGSDNVYSSTSFLGESSRQAHTDAIAWVSEHAVAGGPTAEPRPERNQPEPTDD